MSQPDIKLVIVGSVGIDDIETPEAKRHNLLGGSSAYACAASSFFTKPGFVGVVGTDFPQEFTDTLTEFGMDLNGLQRKEGKTFRWSGVYEKNMDNRRTLNTELNVFADFEPELPESYRKAPYLFLGNIHPALQLHVLDEAEGAEFVLADSMDLWIDIAREDLVKVIGRVNMLTINESEARHLTGQHNLIRAARDVLQMGPEYVLIKKGEHGSILFYEEHIYLTPAFPLEEVHDPTGAGDCFAGGFMGALTLRHGHEPIDIRHSMLYGSVVASFAVEAFSLEGLSRIDVERVEERVSLLKEMLRFA